MISLYDKRIVKKRPYLTTKNWFYPEEDVKEAIRELKKELTNENSICLDSINYKIDKILGKELAE